MNWLQFREPFSAWSHALGFLFALPAALLLWRRSAGSPVKQLAFLVFGASLAVCYAGSTLYHGVRGTADELYWFVTLDYIGIYLLIAGTITPVALIVLEGRWRWGTLALAWLLAACGIALRLVVREMPLAMTTGLYMAMGWGVLACYFELARALSPQAMRPALLGGLLYTLGATLNVLHWPVLVPGLFGPHEVFHLFVLGGSLAHFWFMLQVVAPFERPAGAVLAERVLSRPQPLLEG